MHTAYTLLDLLALAVRLLTPLVGPLLDEWAAWYTRGCASDEPQEQPAATPPAPAETPAPFAPQPVFSGEVVPNIADVPVIVAGRLTRFGESSEPQEPARSVKLDEPLYVRRGEGRGARYLLAGGSEPGERWRRVVRGKRVGYELAGRAGR